MTDGAKVGVATFPVSGGDLEMLSLFDAYNVSFAGTLFMTAERVRLRSGLWRMPMN
jgi:hypothetical protein